MEFAALAEFIGFDVIFIGILTMLAASAGERLWNVHGTTPLSLCTGALEDCRNLFAESAKRIASILILAAVAGMIANFAADQILDSGMLKWVLLPELGWKTESEKKSHKKPEMEFGAKSAAECETKSETNSEMKGLRAEEDWIKASVFCKIAKDDPEKVTLKVSPEEFRKGCDALKQKKQLCDCEMEWRKKAINEGQRFFREALATLLDSGSAPLVGSLQAELLVVRVFRVLFVYSLLLMILSYVAPVSVWWRKPEARRWWPSAVTFVALAAAAYFFLWCWGYQSKRYYKKLGQAYITVAPQRNGALF